MIICKSCKCTESCDKSNRLLIDNLNQLREFERGRNAGSRNLVSGNATGLVEMQINS